MSCETPSESWQDTPPRVWVIVSLGGMDRMDRKIVDWKHFVSWENGSGCLRYSLTSGQTVVSLGGWTGWDEHF